MIQQPDQARRCDLCGRPYWNASELMGICPHCCAHLGGGKFSARIVQQEARAGDRQRDYQPIKRRGKR